MTHQSLKALHDYDSIERLRDQLHRRFGGRRVGGAAILVGSGLSHNSEKLREDAEPFPSWLDLAREVAALLHEKRPESAGTSEMLTLFQMFEDGPGRTALEELIERKIPDGQHAPGRVHRLLLELPWSDVFTTNWDTLLERAADVRDVRRRYTIVTRETDISRAPSPRIVKLHGGLPNAGHIIVTEEDYRCYLEEHAAFVDMVRVSLMENAFCLLGFSSDDPNFVQWHGWVRDRLQRYAHRPTLVLLDKPSRSRRRYLENKGLAVVDLSDFVDELAADRHATSSKERAVVYFLEALADDGEMTHAWPIIFASSARPERSEEPIRPRWAAPISETEERPKPSSELQEQGQTNALRLWREKLDGELDTWRAMLEAYPGWLVLPEDNLLYGDAGKWSSAAVGRVRDLGRELAGAVEGYPCLGGVAGEGDEESTRNRCLAAAEQLDWALTRLSVCIPMALLLRAPLIHSALDELIPAITTILAHEQTALAEAPSAVRGGRSRQISEDSRRQFQQRGRDLALLVAPRLAAEGRHDLLEPLLRAMEREPLSTNDKRRRDMTEAVACAVIGDEWALRRTLDRLAAVEGRSPRYRMALGSVDFATVDPAGYLRTAALAAEIGDIERAEGMVRTALTELSRMPFPSNDGLRRRGLDSGREQAGTIPSGARYDYHQRSREAWARFARLQYRRASDDHYAVMSAERDQNVALMRAEHLEDISFLEDQTGYRCNAKDVFERALASAQAALRANDADVNKVRSFAVLVDEAGAPVSPALATDLGEIAVSLCKAEPAYALALGLRYLQDPNAARSLGYAVAHADRPGLTQLAARRVFHMAGRVLWLPHGASDSAQRRTYENSVRLSFDAAVAILSGALARGEAASESSGNLIAAHLRSDECGPQFNPERSARAPILGIEVLHKLVRCLRDERIGGRPFSVRRSLEVMAAIVPVLDPTAGNREFALTKDLFALLPPPRTRSLHLVEESWKGAGDPVLKIADDALARLEAKQRSEIISELEPHVRGAERTDRLAHELAQARMARLKGEKGAARGMTRETSSIEAPEPERPKPAARPGAQEQSPQNAAVRKARRANKR